MNVQQLARAALVAAAPFVVQACATEGFVLNKISAERARTDAIVAAERTERMTGDSTNAARIADLRAALDSMRTEFSAKIAAVEDGIRFAMPVTFAFDDATVRDQDRPMLDRFARVAQKYYPAAAITIEGFSDPAGSARYNQALSVRRAAAVRDALTQLGLSASQLRAVGYGKTRLVTPGAEKDMPGAERNRRVVFVIESGATDASAVALANTSTSR